MAASLVQLTLVAFALLLVNPFRIVNSQRTKERMYQELNGANCFRRLNGTHEAGCSSKFGGSTGVLHLIRTADDFAFLHDSPPAPPYAVIVPAAFFTRPLIMPLQRSPHVSGIIVIRDVPAADPSANPSATTSATTTSSAPRPPFYTHELACPNSASSYPANATTSCPANAAGDAWNPHGTGMLRESFPFPIIYLDQADQADVVRACHDRHNAHDRSGQHRRSLCSIEIQQFMAAAGSTQICYQRSASSWNLQPTHFCDPMTAKNLHGFLFRRDVVAEQEAPIADTAADSTASATEAPAPASSATATPTPEKFIVISAPMDSDSMFDGVSPGAHESLALVTLLSVAHTLYALLGPQRTQPAQPNVLFAFFNGESYDYIGSQSVARLMGMGQFPVPGDLRAPIAAADVLLHVDLGDLSAPADQLNAFQVTEFPAASALISALDKYNRAFGLNINTTARHQPHLPPSSAHSFLREFNGTWPAVVLRSATANPYLHSFFDDAHSLRFTYANTSADFQQLQPLGQPPAHFRATSAQMQVRNISSLVTFALYELVTGMVYNGQLGASAVLVDELLQCYVVASACRLLRAATHPRRRNPIGRPEPPTRYISVHTGYASQAVTMTSDFLATLTSQRLPNATSEELCNAERLLYGPDGCQWISGADGRGECLRGQYNYTWAYSPAFLIDDYDMASGRYSTWSESSWSAMSARLFLWPSATQEALTLALGFVVMSVAMVLVFLVSSRADVLFGCAAEQRRMVAASIVARQPPAGGGQQQQQQQQLPAPVEC